MSSTTAAPQPSRLPEHLRNQTEPVSQQHESAAAAKLPEPLLRLELRNLRQAPVKVFLDNIDPTTDVSNCVESVLRLLYYPRSSTAQSSATATMTTLPSQLTASSRSSTQARPAPYQPSIPGTRSVTLVLREMDGVAYTTGIDLDDDHKEIHFSLSYINHVDESNKGHQAKIRHELMGVITHELVHCFQWNGRGTAPGGLIEGIADWVRLRAGLAPPHWKRVANKDTDWDAGYETTGYFLDWIEDGFGEGSVRRINEALRETKYEVGHYWQALFGQSVEQLWKSYQKSLQKD